MKRELFEEQHRNMFPNFNSPPPPTEPADTRSPKSAKVDSATTDGATIEVVRRPRGRPPGSKNKPKQPPVIITSDPTEEPSMSPYVLELPSGIDVVESIGRFCRKRGLGLAVLNGHGIVSNVTLRQPAAAHGATVTFHGQFDILSISATILPTGSPSEANENAKGNGQFTIFLAGPQGQVVGGLVVGPLTAAGTVYLIAATFNGPKFDRLPPEDSPAAPESPLAAVSGGSKFPNYQASDAIWPPTRF